jgi:hypothetical protein
VFLCSSKNISGKTEQEFLGYKNSGKVMAVKRVGIYLTGTESEILFGVNKERKINGGIFLATRTEDMLAKQIVEKLKAEKRHII